MTSRLISAGVSFSKKTVNSKPVGLITLKSFNSNTRDDVMHALEDLHKYVTIIYNQNVTLPSHPITQNVSLLFHHSCCSDHGSLCDCDQCSRCRIRDLSSCVIPFPIISHSSLSFFTLPEASHCSIMYRHVVSWLLILSVHTLPYPTLPCPALPHPFLPYPAILQSNRCHIILYNTCVSPGGATRTTSQQ